MPADLPVTTAVPSTLRGEPTSRGMRMIRWGALASKYQRVTGTFVQLTLCLNRSWGGELDNAFPASAVAALTHVIAMTTRTRRLTSRRSFGVADDEPLRPSPSARAP